MRKSLKKLSTLATICVFTASLLMPTSAMAATKKKTTSVSTKYTKTMTAGKKQTIKPTLKYKKTTVKATFTYKSSNKSIAAVSKKGVVTAKKAGKVKITVTAKPKNTKKYKTSKRTYTITVKKKKATNTTSFNPENAKFSQRIIVISPGETATVKLTNANNGGFIDTAIESAPFEDRIAKPSVTDKTTMKIQGIKEGFMYVSAFVRNNAKTKGQGYYFAVLVVQDKTTGFFKNWPFVYSDYTLNSYEKRMQTTSCALGGSHNLLFAEDKHLAYCTKCGLRAEASYLDNKTTYKTVNSIDYIKENYPLIVANYENDGYLSPDTANDIATNYRQYKNGYDTAYYTW